MDIPKNYDPERAEKETYIFWEKSGLFTPENLPERHKEPFSILMPPPNANDPLHIGHALFIALQDLMIRYQRMRGKKTLWLPGSDHAGFETQVVYEKKLKEKGLSRLSMNRDDFYEKVWEYTNANRKIVKEQIKKMGASCDWSRDTFTLDDNVVKTTYKTFKRMADDGLIYRGKRLVNYCTEHETAFSDLEVEYKEKISPLYYIKYGPFNLATVRPETKFGDTAIAVHPEDKRYKKYIGKEVEINTLIGRRIIKVIADEMVDPQFGTGAVKVTPAHDMNDFEMWLRHKDEMPAPIEVIGKDGKLTASAGPYKGMTVMQARKKVSEDMQKNGLMEKIDEDYRHRVSVCYKCKNTLEPILMDQWFIDIKPLANPAINAVKEKRVTIIPQNYEKVYFHWMENIKDWNVSRQNWWGIPIPAWKCTKCKHWTITEGENPNKCEKCEASELVRDGDVFDTWFSSGQWPSATLLSEKEDLKDYYPTSVMETGYDILFFWVARMIMLGIYQTGDVPFRHVYLHGLVRDEKKEKMSKSKGNVIDPLQITKKYGTDALRFALIMNNMPGKDASISETEIRGYRNFINKIWNIYRFLTLKCSDINTNKVPELFEDDKKIFSEFERVSAVITSHMENFRFAHAAEELYHYTWHTFADKHLEQSKEIISGEKGESRKYTLLVIFNNIIHMLHPFAPFITEEIYQSSPTKKMKSIMIEKWPSL